MELSEELAAWLKTAAATDTRPEGVIIHLAYPPASRGIRKKTPEQIRQFMEQERAITDTVKTKLREMGVGFSDFTSGQIFIERPTAAQLKEMQSFDGIEYAAAYSDTELDLLAEQRGRRKPASGRNA